MIKENAVKERTFRFALGSVDLYRVMHQSNEFVMSKQFLRSATSIGANIEEASAAISKNEFIAKMSIASKEARETLYWLKLIEYARIIVYDFVQMKLDCEELIKLLTSIIKTAQKNLAEEKNN